MIGLQVHAFLTFETVYATFTTALPKVTAIDSKNMALHIQCEHRILFWNSYKKQTQQGNRRYHTSPALCTPITPVLGR